MSSIFHTAGPNEKSEANARTALLGVAAVRMFKDREHGTRRPATLPEIVT
jgi:hypothetical protein